MDGRRGLVPSNFIQKVPGICLHTVSSRDIVLLVLVCIRPTASSALEGIAFALTYS